VAKEAKECNAVKVAAEAVAREKKKKKKRRRRTYALTLMGLLAASLRGFDLELDCIKMDRAAATRRHAQGSRGRNDRTKS
jgi:hypothetical protein